MGLLRFSKDMDEVISFVDGTCRAEEGPPKYLVTVNMDYIAKSLKDASFRKTVLEADLRCADGIPALWLSNFLRASRCEKVSGSDLLPELVNRKMPAKYKACIFGTVAESAFEAQRRMNENGAGLEIAEYISPPFASVEELSDDRYIDGINGSGVDILFLSLSAEKAMWWISLNRRRLKVKLICQIGAAIDFLSGKIKRAPRWMQRVGLEWLWRTMQEPRLWRRYLHDGILLVYLFFRYILLYRISLARNK